MNPVNTSSPLAVGALRTADDPRYKIKEAGGGSPKSGNQQTRPYRGEADRLIVSIRDQMLTRVSQLDKSAILELELLLEESSSEFDELRKALP